MGASEAQKRATAKWNSKNQKSRTIAFYAGKDDELLEHLDAQENKSAYVKELIRRDMTPQIPQAH